MAKCMMCGKSEHTMNCVCGECIDPTTNGGYYLSKGYEGIAELMNNQVEWGEIYCKRLPECWECEAIDETKCYDCLMEWLRSKRDV